MNRNCNCNQNDDAKAGRGMSSQQFTPGGSRTPGQGPGMMPPGQGQGPRTTPPGMGQGPRMTPPGQGQGPRMTPPGQGQGPRMTPPGMGQGPGMEQAPRTAPPNFIPEGPGMGQGPESFGAPLGREQRGRGGFQRPMDLRRCINRFTYIWLVNGNNFWFYPTFVDRQFVFGFRWRRNRWEFDRINRRRILFSRCF